MSSLIFRAFKPKFLKLRRRGIEESSEQTRYFKTTKKLRSRKMAAGLLSAVWATSVIICTPPWLVQGWGLFDSLNHYPSGAHQNFTCGYSASVPYRIYSALGSFYIPLFVGLNFLDPRFMQAFQVMLSVYFKIFRVANERESLMRQSVGTCRLSNRLAKNQQEKSIRNNNYRYEAIILQDENRRFQKPNSSHRTHEGAGQ